VFGSGVKRIGERMEVDRGRIGLGREKIVEPIVEI
jgi:hypothetical protein